MTKKVPAYAALTRGAQLAPFTIECRDVGPLDVEIEISHCGVCHSDIHQARDEWGSALFPMVPGHEIIGRVTRTGDRVTKLRAGDLAGVGCMVDSCRSCRPCESDEEQFCERGVAWTYNGTEMDRKTPTFGGYSRSIVVQERFALKVPSSLDAASAAPLLCAGITTYSPLREWNVKSGDQVAIVGLGGLGHMGVKLAKAMGAHVTVLSTSQSKKADAKRLGADEFEVTTERGTFAKLTKRFDLILDTISAPHDYDAHLRMLRPHRTMVIVGVPPASTPIAAGSLIGANRRLAGSLIGGIKQTQEMLDFCAAHGVVSDVEIIPVQKINEAYERMMRGDVRYRFVIDTASI
jgi:alcohol dehydrogenase (NADP+)